MVAGREDESLDQEDADVDSGITLVETASPQPGEAALRQRQYALMEHPFFVLDVRLQEGRDLVVRDTCGTSDPYVKFKVGGKQVFKSRTIYKNLNPRWDEAFSIPVEDVQRPVQVKVFDYDRGLHDDPMGGAEIDLTQLELGRENDLKLLLSDRGKSDYMGYLLLSCTLQPKTQEDKEQFMNRGSSRISENSSRKLKMQTWSGVVTIVLVEGQDLVSMDDNGRSDPYVKFRLANEKYRSKHKNKTLNPRWLEQFDLRIFDDQATQLEITVFDYDARGRDDFMGRATIDLSNLESEKTHHMDVELEDGAGLLKLLLTISGTCTTDALSDLCNFTPDSRQQGQLQKKYSFLKLSDFSDVGHLQVKVFKAQGLRKADIGGNSDPFCVLELVNARVQTHTEYKTLNPEWNKVFSFKVQDIHSVLEVTIFDEDRDKKVEFLGKVAIPLLRIRNGERRWYALKDKKLNRRTKGAILLELDLIFNHVKAAIRTVNPAEEKFMQVEPKFKIQLMKKNIDRVGQLIAVVVETGKFLQSCFSWESTTRSATAFFVFLVMVWNFEIYMLPITLLLIFLKNLLIAQLVGAFKREQVEDDYFEEDEEEDEEKEKQEEKKSFKEKLQSIQDVCLQVQQGMDMVASLGERIKNTFNWTVPWLSALAVVALSAGVIILYLIPLRWLLLAWGINKFTKKLRKPNAVNNNELLDFLSRVPSDRELAQYREFRPEFSPASAKKKRS
ncbi:multiple C2 and transmembrane domain-containing protein 1-like [Babylonia areolata]|uniref:multiple C2 and transmembrane domain-containing protein 1-like n=1 Tax=Babylonia areolata TaxID=304850 RepID=UPI003FCF9256